MNNDILYYTFIFWIASNVLMLFNALFFKYPFMKNYYKHAVFYRYIIAVNTKNELRIHLRNKTIYDTKYFLHGARKELLSIIKDNIYPDKTISLSSWFLFSKNIKINNSITDQLKQYDFILERTHYTMIIKLIAFLLTYPTFLLLIIINQKSFYSLIHLKNYMNTWKRYPKTFQNG